MGTILFCLYLRIFIEPRKSFNILHKLSYVIITAIGCLVLLVALGWLIFGKVSIISLNQLICVNKDLTELHKSLSSGMVYLQSQIIFNFSYLVSLAQ